MASSSLNHGLTDGKEYQLNLGTSFQPSKASQSYHLMRYDFKPASADTSQPAEVKIGTNNECTVTLPNDTGTTTYKGGKKPCTKECILIIDKETGEITLERISSNIALKKSRGNRAPNPSLNKPPNKPTPSPAPSKPAVTTQISSKQSTSLSSSQNSSQGGTFSSPAKLNNNMHSHNINSNTTSTVKAREISSTSDSNSSSSDSSDSDSETEKEMAKHIEMETFSSKAYEPPPPPAAATAPPPAAKPGGMFLSNLHSDLQLSESESDSD